MGRSQETFNKKEVRNKKEKKRKEKEKKRLAKKENEKSSSLDDMIAYVDENGMLSSTPPDPAKKEKVKAEDIEINIPKRTDDEKEDTIKKGVISFFNESKGFGFIRDLETKASIFVHVNNSETELKEGLLVTYETELTQRGQAAINVKKA